MLNFTDYFIYCIRMKKLHIFSEVEMPKLCHRLFIFLIISLQLKNQMWN